MKMKFRPDDELESNIELIKQKVRRNQTPKKNAPRVPPDLLIVLSGCTFRVHEQTEKTLIIKADEKINFDNNINIIRSTSYIKGIYKHVSIFGWDWRVDRFKKSKLFLTPHAPTLSVSNS